MTDMTDDSEFTVSTDPLALEDEWRGHSQLVLNAAGDAADLQEKYELAKEFFEYVAAKTALAVRADPEKFGLKSATDKSVEAVIATNEDCRDAQKRMIGAKHAMKKADGRVLALEHRKRALSKLCDLYAQEYYSDQRPKNRSNDDRLAARREMFERRQQLRDDATEDDDNDG